MIIVIKCQDRVGLVAEISKILFETKLNIISMREHVDVADDHFFVRLEVSGSTDTTALHKKFQAVLPASADIIVDPAPVKKIVVLVTKEHHCLSDILVRNHFNTLGASVQAVCGNHKDLADVCARFGIPFHHVSHEGKSKEVFEKELSASIDKYSFDYLVLAKFMRILSPAFVEKYPLKMINIHHSFLPAFIGASPYKQAYDRGVKLIGATAHYVTNDLDQGPIIVQQIIPVDHTFTPATMMKAGLEIETSVLAKALNLVFEDRVFVSHNKTVVFG